MKTVELQKVPKNKIGKLNKNGLNPEPHEEDTLNYLLLFGFDIELVIPTGIPNAHNPDFFFAGAVWEMKSPTTSNQKTLKKRVGKASQQARRAVFDLRRVERRYDATERFIMKMFLGNRDLRKMILIQKTGKVLEITK